MIPQLMAVLGLAVGTWLIRAGFIASPRGRALAVQLDPWLTNTGPAVLAALLASLSMRGTVVEEIGLVAYALGLGAALAVALVTRSLPYALIAGVAGLALPAAAALA